MHYSALDIGRVFLLAGLAQIILMPVVGRVAPKFDQRVLLFIGVTIVGFSQWIAAQLTNQAGFGDLVMPQFVRAVGLAFVFIPVSVAALSDLSPAQRGNATGLFNLTRELGGSLGTAWMGKLVADGIVGHTANLATHVTPYDPLVQERLSMLAGRGLPAEAVLDAQVRVQAMVMSFEDGFRITMAAILMGVFLVMLMRRAKPTAGMPAGAH
jgi:DHA2 family multidrug resistance protein